MKTFALSLALLAVMAIPAVAVAGSPWTTYEYSSSYNGSFYYDGDVYYGTISYGSSYQWKDNGKNSLSKGSSWWTFEATDGSLSAAGSNHWNNKWGTDSANTFSSNGQSKYYDEDGKLIEVVNTTYHYTVNANGELTSYHWN